MLLIPLASFVMPTIPGAIGSAFTSLGFAPTAFPTNILPLFPVLWLLLGLVYTLILKRTAPERFERLGCIVRGDDTGSSEDGLLPALAESGANESVVATPVESSAPEGISKSVVDTPVPTRDDDAAGSSANGDIMKSVADTPTGSVENSEEPTSS